MKISHLTVVFLILTNVVAYAQSNGSKISYPTGKRYLKYREACTAPKWNKYENGLEYVEVKSYALHCQEFSDYTIPVKTEPSKESAPTPSRSWGKSSGKPSTGAVFVGNHYELVKETELFVQILTSQYSVQVLEQEVLSQCNEWQKSIGMPEPSNNLPSECK